MIFSILTLVSQIPRLLKFLYTTAKKLTKRKLFFILFVDVGITSEKYTSRSPPPPFLMEKIKILNEKIYIKWNLILTTLIKFLLSQIVNIQITVSDSHRFTSFTVESRWLQLGVKMFQTTKNRNNIKQVNRLWATFYPLNWNSYSYVKTILISYLS